MIGFWEAVAQQPFLQNALLGGLLAGLACGVVGAFVVVKRVGYLAGGVAHAALGGMGAAYFFGSAPLVGAAIAAVLSAWIIGWVSLRRDENEDTLIGAVWAAGMAIGILFISKTPGYNVDLMSYLFGNILWTSAEDLRLMAALVAFLIIAAFLFVKPLTAVCFDERFAQLRGVPVAPTYMLLMTMIALTVVLMVRVAGLILVIALLTLPAAIARQYLSTIPALMLGAAALGVSVNVGGLMVSYSADLPSGATIVLMTATLYLLSTLSSRSIKRWRRDRGQPPRSETTST